jgi:ribosomal protein S18 acetylase RimI-like enzyme
VSSAALTILPAQREDIPLLRRMAIETQLDTFAEFNTPQNMDAFIRTSYSVEQFEREFGEPGSIYYIAWSGKEPAGFLRLRTSDEVEQYLGKNAIEIQRLYVTGNYLGKKVGSALMQKALTHARNMKCEWVWLGVWEHNFRAQDFYKKWGFTRFSEHIFWMGEDPQTDWLLKLKL